MRVIRSINAALERAARLLEQTTTSRPNEVSAESVYQCIHCRRGMLESSPPHLSCRRCGTKYPVLLGVPLLLKGAEISRSDFQLTDELGRVVCTRTGLAPGPETIGTLKHVFSSNYHISDRTLVAENNYFLNRLMDISEEYKRPPIQEHYRATPINREVRYAVDLHYIPEVLPADTQQTYNVRISNRGESIISSKTKDPVCLSYHWLTTRGKMLQWDGERTKLPIDLPPGQSLTMPMLLRTPRADSDLLLEVTLVHESVAWLDAFARRHRVQVTPQALPAPWKDWNLTKIKHGDYNADHEAGKKILFAEIARLHKPKLRILEVGGCWNPMTQELPHTIYSVDIDMQTLQIGHLRYGQEPHNIHFVCADGADLPFRDHSFDCVAMFSTLHHFANPTQVLRGLSRLVRRPGFIAVLCEPIGHYLNGDVYEDFIKELEHGINEQTFSLEEYHRMFTGAGLRSVDVTVDVGSLKAILKAA